jgi:Protein of unknown function (DUF2971)
MPDANTLCHYTTAEAAFVHIIPSAKLRLSRYTKMSDPLENRELPIGAYERGEGADFNEKVARVIDMITLQRDATRLLSLTIDATEGYAERDIPFQYAWARARLWQQYADNHAGVCLVFDREEATAKIYARLAHQGLAGQGEVDYFPRGFSDTPAASIRTDDFDLENLERQVAVFVVDHEHALFFSKALDWKSEHEYRFTLMPNVTGKELPEYSYVHYGTSLREVILGERFPQWQIPAARAVCDPRGIPVTQLHWSHGRPWPVPTRPGTFTEG